VSLLLVVETTKWFQKVFFKKRQKIQSQKKIKKIKTKKETK